MQLRLEVVVVVVDEGSVWLVVPVVIVVLDNHSKLMLGGEVFMRERCINPHESERITMYICKQNYVSGCKNIHVMILKMADLNCGLCVTLYCCRCDFYLELFLCEVMATGKQDTVLLCLLARLAWCRGGLLFGGTCRK